MSLDSKEAARRGRLGALATLSRHDPHALTEKARERGPGQLAYWIKQVDPDGALPEAEAERRARYARTLHFTRLAAKSAEARRARRAAA